MNSSGQGVKSMKCMVFSSDCFNLSYVRKGGQKMLFLTEAQKVSSIRSDDGEKSVLWKTVLWENGREEIKYLDRCRSSGSDKMKIC